MWDDAKDVNTPTLSDNAWIPGHIAIKFQMVKLL